MPAWERIFVAHAVVESDPERAFAELDAGLAEQPHNPSLHYHPACILARTGRLEDARASLDRTLELDPKLGEWAEKDEDLEPLRRA